jgi:hypothetical protein
MLIEHSFHPHRLLWRARVGAIQYFIIRGDLLVVMGWTAMR